MQAIYKNFAFCVLESKQGVTVLTRWNWLGVFFSFFLLMGSVNKCCWYYKFYSAATLSSVREKISNQDETVMAYGIIWNFTLFSKHCIGVFHSVQIYIRIFKGCAAPCKLQMGWKPNYTHTNPFSLGKLILLTPLQSPNHHHKPIQPKHFSSWCNKLLAKL